MDFEMIIMAGIGIKMIIIIEENYNHRGGMIKLSLKINLKVLSNILMLITTCIDDNVAKLN